MLALMKCSFNGFNCFRTIRESAEIVSRRYEYVPHGHSKESEEEEEIEGE